MPTDHAPEPQTGQAMSFMLPAAHYRHVESQARRLGMSRAAFIRMLVARDIEQVAQRRQAS